MAVVLDQTVHVAQLDAGVRLPVVDERVVVRGEESAALDGGRQMVHDGVGNRGAVEGRRAAAK
eukprot:CAMPEP_0182594472 /NCGR_PEP_ID=MMETSP1324-20130603/80223_1 /TAXON_ID=236786 /ORGANISM="Florenciella sp., Strain RCC1587" /LENGTH=62 /DNA_ID=CAMNT_0024812021 /DNA_START=1 /DNA_END=186 /DNA_ORIENTATION=-